MKQHAIFVLGTIAAFGCTGDVPETPGFQTDVMPILAANCVRCHGYPSLGGSPIATRLDSYDNIVVRGGDDRPPMNQCGILPFEQKAVICGARERAKFVKARIVPGVDPEVGQQSDPGPMPPRFPLDDHQIDTLLRWYDQGAERGEPRADNKLPEISVEPLGQQEKIVTLAVAIDDPDGDLVVGELYARVGNTEVFVGAARTGHVVIDWDTQTLPNSGAIPVFAKLDDGAGFQTYELGTVEIR